MDVRTQNFESASKKVRAFLANELAVPENQINLTSRLRQDLKMDGVDAANILEAFCLSFDVDMSGFRANDYFSVEGVRPLPVVFSWFFWFFGNGKPLKTLTVLDLIEAFDSGVLR